jgi:hypothetical protein
MKRSIAMLLRKALLTLIFSSGATLALAQSSGTPEEQDSCRPDVRKFCSKVDPAGGDTAFLTCLEDNRDKLSKKCLAVLTDHGR